MARPKGSKNFAKTHGVKCHEVPVRDTKFVRDNLYRLTEGCRTRAKAGGYPCEEASTLMRWLEINLHDRCPALGIEMECGKGFSHGRSPTVHKIVPEKGYVLGNIVVISRLANDLINAGIPDLSLRAMAFQETMLANGGPR